MPCGKLAAFTTGTSGGQPKVWQGTLRPRASGPRLALLDNRGREWLGFRCLVRQGDNATVEGWHPSHRPFDLQSATGHRIGYSGVYRIYDTHTWQSIRYRACAAMTGDQRRSPYPSAKLLARTQPCWLFKNMKQGISAVHPTAPRFAHLFDNTSTFKPLDSALGGRKRDP